VSDGYFRYGKTVTIGADASVGSAALSFLDGLLAIEVVAFWSRMELAMEVAFAVAVAVAVTVTIMIEHHRLAFTR
jgi:hypothetical protein